LGWGSPGFYLLSFLLWKPQGCKPGVAPAQTLLILVTITPCPAFNLGQGYF
jgi:hypothetical protein